VTSLKRFTGAGGGSSKVTAAAHTGSIVLFNFLHRPQRARGTDYRLGFSLDVRFSDGPQAPGRGMRKANEIQGNWVPAGVESATKTAANASSL
jgi:hypothetical protein